jgi:hypothetical protein
LPCAGQNDANGLAKNSEIQAQAPVANVFLVELHTILEGGIPAGRDLPKPGQSRGYIEAAQVFQGVLSEFPAGRRARPNQAHLAFEDVPKLGQFIDAVFSEVSAHARDSRIGGNLEKDSVAFIQVRERCFQFIGIFNHGSELETDNGYAFLARRH